MFDKRILLIQLIFVIVQESTHAEWVEVPQFSDAGKVYRMPYTQHDRGQKYFLANRDVTKIYSNASTGDTILRPIVQQYYEAVATTVSTPLNPATSLFLATKKSPHSLENGETFTKNPQSEETHTEDAIVEDEKEEVLLVSTINLNDKIVIENDQPYEAASAENQSDDETVEPEVDVNDRKPSFLAFIPFELFKRVHAILKSQSTTAEGKIAFLKRFEKALLREIEKRLVPVFSPVRKKRSSRGDHGWDDHEKGVGFPSLEGALMAIAFLTFAVYLIQLVMMLFRNLGNTTNTTVPTPTILFNRNKRSIYELNEETARILGYLDEYAENQYHP